jgi:hypothetical protein
VFGFIHSSLVANTETILAISALVKKSPNLALLISLIVVISFSHAYKYAAISSAERLDHSTEHLSLTCHPNSISSSSSHPFPHHGFSDLTHSLFSLSRV